MARKRFEDNRTRFKTLAEQRTNKVLESIRILSDCANPYLYDFKTEEVERIFGAIEIAFREAKLKFTKRKRESFVL